eukprot:gene19712-biopygen4035
MGWWATAGAVIGMNRNAFWPWGTVRGFRRFLPRRQKKQPLVRAVPVLDARARARLGRLFPSMVVLTGVNGRSWLAGTGGGCSAVLVVA